MKQEGLFTLISEAREMLLDRSKEERDLIYYIAKMDSEERAAIIMAYQTLKDDGKI